MILGQIVRILIGQINKTNIYYVLMNVVIVSSNIIKKKMHFQVCKLHIRKEYMQLFCLLRYNFYGNFYAFILIK